MDQNRINSTQGMWGQETKYFHQLSPEQILEASEIFGKRLTGKVMALNSLENRVYDVELAQNTNFDSCYSSQNVILKFYRPGRWTKEQIQEEHDFLLELAEFEVPVVAPILIGEKSLHYHEKTNLYFALFPKVMGRLKDEFTREELEQAGRLIGRIHNIGQMKSFIHRPKFCAETYIKLNASELQKISPSESASFRHYLDLTRMAYDLIHPVMNITTSQRLHGDFHRGNIVWTRLGPMAVDFDDCVSGPIEQDLWPLVPGTDSYSLEDRMYFHGAYKEMTKKEVIKTHLTESLRTMRLIHFNAWIAKRWEDESFKKMFPQFISDSYWDQQVLDLRLQISLIQDQSSY